MSVDTLVNDLINKLTTLAADVSDDDIKEDLTTICQKLELAGNAYKDNDKDAAQKVVEAADEALIVWEKSMKNLLSQQAKATSKALLGVTDMDNIIANFQTFISSCIGLFRISDSLCDHVGNKHYTDEIKICMSLLYHNIQLLPAVIKSLLQYPQNRFTSTTKDFVFKSINKILKNVIEINESEELTKANGGGFVHTIDTVLAMLENTKSVKEISERTEIKEMVEVIVAHAVDVAQSGSGNDYDVLTKLCQKCLSEMKNLFVVSQDSKCNDWLLSRDLMIDCLELLEQNVNAAVLRYIVQVFADPYQPLENLLIAVQESSVDVELRNSDDKSLTPHIDALDLHMDALVQICHYAIQCSQDEKTIETLRTSLSFLEGLEPELVPSVTRWYTQPDDKAVAKHIQMLYGAWKKHVQCLLRCLDEMTDSVAFTQIALDELTCAVKQMLKESGSKDINATNAHVKRITAQARHVGEMSVQYLGSDVCKEQNQTEIMQKHAEDLITAITECKRKSEELNSKGYSVKVEESLLKRIQVIHTIVKRIATFLAPDESTSISPSVKKSTAFASNVFDISESEDSLLTSTKNAGDPGNCTLMRAKRKFGKVTNLIGSNLIATPQKQTPSGKTLDQNTKDFTQCFDAAKFTNTGCGVMSSKRKFSLATWSTTIDRQIQNTPRARGPAESRHFAVHVIDYGNASENVSNNSAPTPHPKPTKDCQENGTPKSALTNNSQKANTPYLKPASLKKVNTPYRKTEIEALQQDLTDIQSEVGSFIETSDKENISPTIFKENSKEVWKNFSAFLKAKSPACNDKASDDPFSQSVYSTPREKLPEVSLSTNTNISISPFSTGFCTPDRIRDLKIVQERLSALKSGKFT